MSTELKEAIAAWRSAKAHHKDLSEAAEALSRESRDVQSVVDEARSRLLRLVGGRSFTVRVDSGVVLYVDGVHKHVWEHELVDVDDLDLGDGE